MNESSLEGKTSAIVLDSSCSVVTSVLTETKQRFSQLFSVHVYSVQKFYLKVRV